jgi:uncharacterized protein YifE (UPF0438 family)
MNSYDISHSVRKFTDSKNFPRGFRKSGDFSIVEADLLTQIGNTLLALSEGSLQPVTDDEKRFVRVLNGELMPETSVEKVWMKYLRLTRSPRKFYTLNSSSRSVAATYSKDDIDVDDMDDNNDEGSNDELDYELG